MQEMAQQLQVSKPTVFEHVEALVKKGMLRREANKARSLTVDPTVDLGTSGGASLRSAPELVVMICHCRWDHRNSAGCS